jgi:hypothetical protein
MKRFAAAILSLIVAPTFAGDLYQHFQLPLIDAYVDSTNQKEADIPGLGRAQHHISVSLTTADSQCSYFALYIRVQLENGSVHPIAASLYRESLSPTTATFHLGGYRPVKILEFYVVRLHPEPADRLIAAATRN